jgi:hypothetical protein
MPPRHHVYSHSYHGCDITVPQCLGAGLAVYEVVLPSLTVVANITLPFARFAFFPCSLEMNESIVSHVLRTVLQA